MKKFKLALAGALLVAMSVLLAACGGGSDKPDLTVNLFQENTTLDWQAMSSVGEIQIYNWVMEGLTRSAGKGVVKPGIAEKWDVSKDGKTWTFHLRDAKWSDGQPVTSADFVYGVKRALDPTEEPKAYAYFLYDIVGAADYNAKKADFSKVGISAPDAKTVVFKLTSPVTYFDYLVSFPTYSPVREDKFKEFGKDYNKDAKHFVTNGPFKIDTWTMKKDMMFVKNADYWDAASIKLNKVHGLMIDNPQTEVNMFVKDQLDMVIALDSEQKKTVIDSKKATIGNYSDGSVWFLTFNTKEKALNNKNIRKALTYAIDRQTFIDKVAKQPWKPALAYVQPDIIPNADGSAPFRDAVPAYFKDNDVATAKALLAKGLKEEGLSKLPKFNFLVNDADPAPKYAQAFQAMWKDNLGVEVTIEPVPSSVRIDRMTKHEFEICLGGWGPDYPDPMTDLDLYVTGAGNNFCDYSSPEYDKLIADAKAETDKAKKFELMYKAEALLMEDMPIGPLYFRYRDFAVKNNVKGFTRDSFAPDINFIYASVEK